MLLCQISSVSPSTSALHLLFAQELDSMKYINMPSSFQVNSANREPKQKIRSREKTAVNLLISLVIISCETHSAQLRPLAEGHLLLLKQLLCRPFLF